MTEPLARHDSPLSTTSAGTAAHLLRRWPFLLGILALTANASGGLDSHAAAFVIVLASTCYLAAAALGSRASGWVMVGVVSVAVVIARLTGLDATVTVLVLGAALAVFGYTTSRRADRREVTNQTIAFVVFSGIAVTAMMSGPVLAGALAAAVAIGHAVWDVVHLERDAVVNRSLAEACLVLDLGLGLGLLLVSIGALSL